MATTGDVRTLPIGTVGETPSFTQGMAPSSSADGKSDKDMFLKLLVAQLKYQDPSKPADSSQFVAQTAQFTLVEKMDQLVDSYTNQMQAAELTTATGMLGSTITYTDGKNTKTGVVSGVSISGGVPTLLVGNQEVAIAAVSKIVRGDPSTTPAAPTTPTTPTTGTGATTPATGTTTPATGTGTTGTGTTGTGTTPAAASVTDPVAVPPSVAGMYTAPTSGSGIYST